MLARGPAVACFHTAFHASLGPVAHPLPAPDGVPAPAVRRYGFHGLSLQHVVDVVPGLGRAVVAHLGGGCSVTAVDAGRSVATSMSVSPTRGVPSVTLSGDLDPEVLLLLMDRGWTTTQLRHLVDRSSGLAGIAAGRTDVAEITVLAEAGDSDCRLALEVFCTAVATTVAEYSAVLGGLDTLVFTGGIGGHSAVVRDQVTSRLAHLGMLVDGAAFAPGDVSAPGSSVRTLVVAADKEQVMARQALELLGTRTPSSAILAPTP